MQSRHTNPSGYFQEQARTTREFVLPFIEGQMALDEGTLVAEVGCGIGGNMLPFLERGCTVYGIDLSRESIGLARALHRDTPCAKPKLVAADIFEVDPSTLPRFDLIVVRDVLEHIHGHERFVARLSALLAPGGIVFMGFPPFSMPFAGHQQICVNKLASVLPYYHLLPRSVYGAVLRMFGESPGKVRGLLEIRDTRIHLWKFHRIVGDSPLRVVRESLYLINPNYRVKFGLKPRLLPRAMNIPRLREFFITTCYVLLAHDGERRPAANR